MSKPRSTCLQFSIPGTPVSEARHRTTIKGGKIWAYTPTKTTEYRKKVAFCALQARYRGEPHTGAVRLDIQYYFPIPKSRRDLKDGQPHTQKPDEDNLRKAVQDALKGVFWKDDCQIYCPSGAKWWTTGEARSEVTIWLE